MPMTPIKKAYIIFIAFFLLLCSCGTNTEVYQGEKVSIGVKASDDEKEQYYIYDPSLSYQLPSDLDKKTKKMEEEYLKELQDTVEDFESQWNLHVWTWYYKPKPEPIDAGEGFKEFQKQEEIENK